MGKVRAFSTRQKWTDQEVAVLRTHYATTSRAGLTAMFPDRPIRSIECKANGLGLAREKAPARTQDQVREAKRKQMADRRASDPDAVREYQRAFYHGNRDRQKQIMRDYYARRFFWSKASKLRRTDRATAKELASIWKQQRGRCALTGARLGRDAHLDHKLPKARGGGDAATNLQWVSPAVNLAKRDMTDAEFLAMCASVMEWLGERINLVDRMEAAA